MSKLSTALRSQSFSLVSRSALSTHLDARVVSSSEARSRPTRNNARQHGHSLLESTFVSALVHAGQCKEHRLPNKLRPQRRALHASRRNHAAAQERTHDIAEPRGLPSGDAVQVDVSQLTRVLPDVDRRRYQKMVDIYGIEEEEPHTPATTHYPLAPSLVITSEQEDRRRHTALEVSPDHVNAYTDFLTLLELRPGYGSLDSLWEAYEKLPSPQVKYLSFEQIDRLFQHTMGTQYRNSVINKERLQSIIAQCSTAKIRLRRHHWTSAIVLAGRSARHTSSEDLTEAIELWVKMEDSGVKADHVVLHVLFDLAVKAARFALAETIHEELKARSMPLNRYFRASVIQQAGERKDGDAVRAAFTDFVHAGEIVDTTIMNLVIRCLVRSGEGEAAEHVFDNMKELHREKFPTRLPDVWQDRRFHAKQYSHMAMKLRKQQDEHESSFFGSQYSNKEQLEELQRLAPIHPDATTYRTLIGYHALISGNFVRMQDLLQEMQKEGHHVHGSVYNNIFAGFVRHGGHADSLWSPGELENLWHEFVTRMPLATIATGLDAKEHYLDELDQPLHWSVAFCKNVLFAFYRCAGVTRMKKVLIELQARWHSIDDEQRQTLKKFAHRRVMEHYWKHWEPVEVL